MSRSEEKFAALMKAHVDEFKMLVDARRNEFLKAGHLLRRIVEEGDRDERERLGAELARLTASLFASYAFLQSVSDNQLNRDLRVMHQEEGRDRRALNAATKSEELKRQWLDIRKSLRGGFRDKHGHVREAARDLNAEADRRLAALLSTPRKKVAARTIANRRHKERWLAVE